MKKKITLTFSLLLIVAILATGVLTACGGETTSTTSAPTTAAPTTSAPTTQPPAAKVLKIGGINALTGVMSGGELLMNKGETIAVSYINSHGGITVNGQKYTIELVTADTKSSAQGMMTACNQLLGQDIKFFVGGNMSEENIAASTVLAPAGAMNIFLYTALTAGEIGPKQPLCFGVQTGMQGFRLLLNYLKKIEPEAKTLAWIAPDDGGTPDRIKYFTPVEQEYGFKTIFYDSYQQDMSDFTPIVQKALNAKADIFFGFDGWPFHLANILKTARGLGYTKPFFGTPPNDPLDVAGATGDPKIAEGYFGPCYPYARTNTPMLEEVWKVCEAEGLPPTAIFWPIIGFNGLWVEVNAIQAAQSLDPAVVAKYLNGATKVDTVYGPGKMGGLKTFGINNEIVNPMYVVQIQSGKDVVVTEPNLDYCP